MTATIRNMTLALALVAGPALAAGANACPCKEKCGHAEAKHGCSYTPAKFASRDQVSWVNRGVSFGNHLAFTKAEIPEETVRQAPEFQPVYFDLDKADLKPAGKATADGVVAYMKAHPNDKVRIEGNCCDLASDEYNMQLGQRRADAVKQYLVEQGVDAGRITTVSFGEQHLIAGPDHRELDRRADVVVWFLDAAH